MSEMNQKQRDLNKNMKIICLLAVLIIIFSSFANAASVYEKNGSAFYKGDDGKIKQLTQSDCDRSPVLNPKGDWVYFIHSYEGKWVEEKYYPPKGVVYKDGLLKEEIWRVKIAGTEGTMLFRNDHEDGAQVDADNITASVSNIQFSPDGDKVYFETPEWPTSDELHVMDVDGKNERVLGAGNNTKIVLSARTFDDREKSYKGYIVTAQHRYFFYGGSYDWFYLFTPDLKKEIAPLGEDPSYFNDVGEIKYTDHSGVK